MIYYQKRIERMQAAEAASLADLRMLDLLFFLMLRVIYPFISVMHELRLALEPDSRETAFMSWGLSLMWRVRPPSPQSPAPPPSTHPQRVDLGGGVFA
jgi:hypothetical protein